MQPDRPTRVRWGVTSFLCAAATLAYLDRVVISNVVKEIQDSLHLDKMGAAWVLVAFIVGYGVMQVPAGRMGDRVGVRFALPAIVVLWSLMTILTPLARTFLLLLAVRCAFGIAQAGVFPFSIPALRRWFPLEARGTPQGIVVAGTRIGTIIASLTALAMQWLSWQVVFYLCGILGVAWALAFANWFRDHPSEHAAVNEEEMRYIGAPASAEKQAARLPLSLLLRNRTILGMSSAQFFSAMGYYLFITWFTTYLREQFDLPLWKAGLLTLITHVGGFAGSAVGGNVLDLLLRWTGSLRWSRGTVWILGKAGCGLIFLLAARQSNPLALVLIISVGTFLSDAANPAAWAAVTDVGRRHSGVVFGMQNTVGAFGAALCPFIVAFVAERWGWQPVLPVFAGIFFAAAASWLWVDVSRPIPEPGESAQSLADEELAAA